MRYREDGILRSEASELALRKVARILTVLPNFVIEDLGPHLVNRLCGEEGERLRNSNWRYSNVFQLEVFHGVDLRRRGKGKMFLWVEGDATSLCG